MPSVNLGAVMHAREVGARNRFRYAHFSLCLPLSQLADIRVAGLGINRPGPLAVHECDHGPRDGSPLLPWVRAILQRHGLACADGEVILQAMPRLFGYVFNPVSFYWCHDREGRLRAVLCEVNNTFGEHHDYLVAHPDGRPIEDEDELIARKVFHVSPFFPVRGEYRCRFVRPHGHRSVAIDYWEGGVLQLATRQSGRDLPLNTRHLWRAWLRCPLLTFAVIWRIHWQALRLAVRRVPFFRKPQPPRERLT